MHARYWLLFALVMLLRPTPATAEAKKEPNAGVFGQTLIHEIDLSLTAKQWDIMQPVGGFAFPFPGKDKAKPPEAKTTDTHKGGFGMTFPWTHGQVTIDGTTFKDVGLRFKGNYTHLASMRALKRPIKIDLDRYDDDGAYKGLVKLNLNNGVTDSERLRETLAYAIFRDAGVLAPRTAFAKVTLSVDDKYKKEFVGLYTMVEQIDGTFLTTHFKTRKGLLLKPENLRGGIEYFGEDWATYEKRYGVKENGNKKQRERLMAFAKLVNKSSDEEFKKAIGSYLDTEAFLRFLAVNALISNLDSFLAFGHNYYLYLRPDNKFLFIPWDVDLAFGWWPPGGSGEQQMNLSLKHPHAGANKLIDRLLAIKEMNERYNAILKELTKTVFTKEKLLKSVETIEKAIKEPLAKEAKAIEARKEPRGFGMGGPGMFATAPKLRTFIEKRTESVANQLAGKTEGFVPRPFGMPGFGPGKKP